MKRKSHLSGTTIGLSLASILCLTSLIGCESSSGVKNDQAAASQPTAQPASATNTNGTETPLKLLTGDVLSLAVEHPKIKAKIGEPAILSPDDGYPKLKLKPKVDGTVSAIVLFEDGSTAAQFAAKNATSGQEVTLETSGKPQKPGRYDIQIKLSAQGYEEATDHIAFTVMTPEQQSKNQAQAVYLDDKGKLKYAPDYKGNTIPDFSNAGYMGGGVKLPDVQVKATVEPGDGDDGARIQAAIDQVSKLERDKDGFRGAVLLKKGSYQIAGSIKISSSGVVLRGEGQGEDGTVLLAAGTAKRALVQVAGSSGAKLVTEPPRVITDLYVPVGSRSFHVQSVKGLKVGDTVFVRKIGNKDFISFLKMDRITLRPGKPSETKMWDPFNLDFDRVVTAIDGNRITVDAPLTDAIDSRWGGGTVIRSQDGGRIEKVGIENLRGDTEYNKEVKKTDKGKSYLADENHANDFISMNNLKNGWVRDFTATHFSISAVNIGKGAKWITVQDAKNLDMISVLTGGLRYPFNVNGELILVQRAYSESARHAFVLGSQVKGPNVFLQGVSHENYATSEPHHRWSVGGLFDNVSAPIAIQDRQYYGSGHGWAGANYVLWNTSGPVVAQNPPTAATWVIGHVGAKSKGAFEPRDPAFMASYGNHVEPRSLYLKQLEDRLGAKALEAIGTYSFPDTFDENAQDVMSGDDNS
ncbi:glycoside hydrolase family 55 protein [Paenibacillus allorhizosphaerae]|uniref:Pectate lyase superfamily protein domain-containing protein n=1 Tax=Paenibacillus allorhizosphaerae TaxID=2849866 RepID=A0ABM8VAT7_9BACL|nr:glycoside hydrolase family 55 protein [Paenibacillus allorhizosphaerae]CAG7616878.1 hypothetical protein PAECIP111802_00338 [Paenibacillus allorhizosphaerae]